MWEHEEGTARLGGLSVTREAEQARVRELAPQGEGAPVRAGHSTFPRVQAWLAG